MSGETIFTSPGETLEKRTTPDGHEVALVQRGTEFEIIYNGNFLMASDCRRSEQSLAELSLAPLGQRDDVTVLVAGLGMGHTLRAVLDVPGIVRVDVVEISDAVVEWNRKYFTGLNKNALGDPRVRLHTQDLLSFLKKARLDPSALGEDVKDGWLAMLLDVDNGPAWTTRPENDQLYTDEGLGRLEKSLRHGGVLGVWSAARDIEFLRRMHARLVNVAELGVPVDVGGKPNLDYVYRGRRPPEPRVPGAAPKGSKMPQA